MIKLIDLFEKIDNGDGTQSLIAECNGYVDGVILIQFSRSPFTFSLSMTDEEIITHLWANEYKIYQ